MGLFKPSENKRAFLKAGFMGFAGSGKTYTASELMIGVVRMATVGEAVAAPKPAFFIDTETGSDWVAPRFKAAGVPLVVARTRSFADLLTAVNEAEAGGSGLIIDSISHFWRELCDSYAKKKGRDRLQFQDWAWLKKTWGEFTDAFINSQLHIILCGRAGFEYDYFEDDDGKKELQKTGIKMKAETEMGYEPSLLVLMERTLDMATKKTVRTATVLKDRSTSLDGGQFQNPTFADFKPHVEFLNLGGVEVGVDLSRSSEGLMTGSGRPRWEVEKETREIVLAEARDALILKWPGQTGEEKKAKAQAVKDHFGVASWEAVGALPLHRLVSGFRSMHEAVLGAVPESLEKRLWVAEGSER